ncbi:hypothetical protein, partial [Lentzea sp. NBRC 102530]|uniref:hypothetical protein n=1 Tax=Lentzea sp. NBRC 102530 TaxID=3032201 RepID=UPI002554F897
YYHEPLTSCNGYCQGIVGVPHQGHSCACEPAPWLEWFMSAPDSLPQPTVPRADRRHGAIWVPVAAPYRTIARLLLPPERLELARCATHAIWRMTRPVPFTSRLVGVDWAGHGGALCALALTTWEELREGEHHEDAQRGIAEVARLQYKAVHNSRYWLRPPWWGSEAHEQYRALLVARQPAYEGIFDQWFTTSFFSKG